MLVTSETHGDVVVLTLNRHEKRNALSVELVRTLIDALASASTSCRAILITGAGSVFCAGADLSENKLSGGFFEAFNALTDAIRGVKVPVVAYINGPAIGAGMMLTMACDLRVAARTARFSIPVGDMAIGVNSGVVRSLTELLGGARARLMLLAGATLNYADAVAAGYCLEGTYEDALALASTAAAKAPLTVHNLKMEFAPDLFTADQREAQQRAPFESADIAEAARARAEKRASRFMGR